MDEIDSDELQRLYDATTSGNWGAAKSTNELLYTFGSYTHGGIAALYIKLGGSARILGMDFDKVEDAQFAAAAHNAMPNILAELRELRSALAAATARSELLRKAVEKAYAWLREDTPVDVNDLKDFDWKHSQVIEILRAALTSPQEAPSDD